MTGQSTHDVFGCPMGDCPGTVRMAFDYDRDFRVTPTRSVHIEPWLAMPTCDTCKESFYDPFDFAASCHLAYRSDPLQESGHLQFTPDRFYELAGVDERKALHTMLSILNMELHRGQCAWVDTFLAQLQVAQFSAYVGLSVYSLVRWASADLLSLQALGKRVHTRLLHDHSSAEADRLMAARGWVAS